MFFMPILCGRTALVEREVLWRIENMVGARVTPLLFVLLLGSQQLPPPGAVAAPQLALAPCTLNGIPGPMRCGTFPVWEDREAKAGRRIELSIIVLSALKTPRPDPLVMIQGGPGD